MHEAVHRAPDRDTDRQTPTYIHTYIHTDVINAFPSVDHFPHTHTYTSGTYCICICAPTIPDHPRSDQSISDQSKPFPVSVSIPQHTHSTTDHRQPPPTTDNHRRQTDRHGQTRFRIASPTPTPARINTRFLACVHACVGRNSSEIEKVHVPGAVGEITYVLRYNVP